MKNWLNMIFVAVAAMGGYLLAVKNIEASKEPGFAETIRDATYIELTHTMVEGTPPGPSGNELPTIKTFRAHDDGTAKINRYNFPGQWGTHVDPPIHFAEGLRALDDIQLSEMVLPLVVIDVHEKVIADNDYQVSLEDIANWEAAHGKIPEKTFVALRTDWSQRWPSLDEMRNRDDQGISHSPGWSREVIDYLILERNVTAIGHETLDTDPGIKAGAGEWPLQTYYMGLNKYQIENMTNLNQLPPIGATIIASWAKVKDGSGFPARVFAIIPKK